MTICPMRHMLILSNRKFSFPPRKSLLLSAMCRDIGKICRSSSAQHLCTINCSGIRCIHFSDTLRRVIVPIWCFPILWAVLYTVRTLSWTQFRMWKPSLLSAACRMLCRHRSMGIIWVGMRVILPRFPSRFRKESCAWARIELRWLFRTFA